MALAQVSLRCWLCIKENSKALDQGESGKRPGREREGKLLLGGHQVATGDHFPERCIGGGGDSDSGGQVPLR